MLNTEQFMSIVRNVLQIAGTFLTTHGLLTTSAWEPIAGGLLMIAPVVWGLIRHTDANSVAVVDKMAKDPMSPVAGVITNNTPEGRDLAASIHGTTTAAAGSADAERIVQKAM